jgi:hypothetical protein
MFLFNDVIILCSKKDSAEVFDVQQVRRDDCCAILGMFE